MLAGGGDRWHRWFEVLVIADGELANRRGKRRKSDPHDARDIVQRLARGECPLGLHRR
ncbi:MAG: hypothetical protein KKE86_06235 [Planctomycetes bacterium]|nr:hypothetical protein [Planctomycetota bacterium]MBU4398920.1 hypothetical protein [Planctomycetota bacterium]MCG2682272.1 hypothetical protein [Planctomycetales bacterium]